MGQLQCGTCGYMLGNWDDPCPSCGREQQLSSVYCHRGNLETMIRPIVVDHTLLREFVESVTGKRWSPSMNAGVFLMPVLVAAPVVKKPQLAKQSTFNALRKPLKPPHFF